MQFTLLAAGKEILLGGIAYALLQCSNAFQLPASIGRQLTVLAAVAIYSNDVGVREFY